MGSSPYYIYGVHPVEELLTVAPERVRGIWAQDWNAPSLRKITRLAQTLELGDMSAAELSRLTRGGNHQGVLVDVEPFSYVDLEDVIEGLEGRTEAIVLILDQVQDVGNLGAIIRSAAAFGVDAIVLPKKRSASVTPAVIRASAGQVWRMPVAQVTNLVRALEELQEAGFWSVTTSVTEGQDPVDVDLCMKVALVVGGEHKGVRRLVGERCDFNVCIPMQEGVESLNVSSASAVLLYEIRRQWKKKE